MTTLRSIRAAACLGLVLALTACARLDGFAFSPTRLTRYELPNGALTPAQIVPVELREGPFLLRSTPGLRLYAIFLHRPGAELGTAPTIVYHHGNADNIDHYWTRVSLLWSFGANVLIYDYRGYGMSEGSPSEDGIFEDGTAATQWIRARTDVDQSRVFHYGYSLGGAVATHMAAFAGTQRGLILEATFTSAAAIAADSSLAVPGSFVTRLRLDTISKIRVAANNSTNGVMFIHGTADDFVQPRYSQDNFDRIGADLADGFGTSLANRRELHRIEGANHSTIPGTAPTDYRRFVTDFIAR